MTDRNVWTCNCAHVFPTMPTCRGEHLIDCPVRVQAEIAADTGNMAALHEEARSLIQAGDVEALADFLNLDVKERARAAYLRMQHVVEVTGLWTGTEREGEDG